MAHDTAVDMVTLVNDLRADQEREDLVESVLLEVCEEMSGDTKAFVEGMFWGAALTFFKTLLEQCGQSTVKKHLDRARVRPGYRRRLTARMKRRFGSSEAFKASPDFARASVTVGIEIDANEWAALAN